MKQMTFVAAVRNFFGMLPGQTLKEFGEEIKALDSKDRAELSIEFAKVGIEITDNKVATA